MCHNEMPKKFHIVVWKDRKGYCCEPCGIIYTHLSTYLLSRAKDILEVHGIRVYSAIEKYGQLRIYTHCNSDRVSKIKESLTREFQILAPEFDWGIW